MKRVFVSTPSFLRKWSEAGLREDDLNDLEQLLLKEPKAGDVAPGTAGMRKLRVQAKGKGKRGGGRVLYKDFEEFEQSYLLFLILKGEQEDLSPEQKKQISKGIQEIEKALKTRKKK